MKWEIVFYEVLEGTPSSSSLPSAAKKKLGEKMDVIWNKNKKMDVIWNKDKKNYKWYNNCSQKRLVLNEEQVEKIFEVHSCWHKKLSNRNISFHGVKMYSSYQLCKLENSIKLLKQIRTTFGANHIIRGCKIMSDFPGCFFCSALFHVSECVLVDVSLFLSVSNSTCFRSI